MSTSTPRPFEGFRIRKTRSSTDGSTGLDYSNARVVDGDISSRIRSLLVSRHASYPPRTPSPSEEHLPPRDIVQSFDFSSARSIARQARSERTQMGWLSLPVAALPDTSMAGDQLARRPSEPNKLLLNDNEVLSSDKSQSRGSPSALGEGDKLKFPRFVSLGQTNPGETVAQSSLHLDEEKHQLGDDIQDALDRSPTWKEHQLIDDIYEPPRRPKTIKEHQLDDDIYDLSHSPRILDEGSDFHFPRLVLVDKPKHGETIAGSDMHPETAKVSQTNGEELGREDGGTFSISQGDVNSRFPGVLSHDHLVESHKSGSTSPARDLNSRTSSAGAQEVQRVRRISHELASIVAQSLSGIGSTSPMPRTRRQSDVSLAPTAELANQNHKKYSPSLLSGASRSSVRHSLLKSGVSSSQLVDTGLPVPPVLTPVAVVPPTPSSQSLARSIHEPSGAQSPKSLVGTLQHESSADYWRNMSITPGDGLPGAFPQSPAAVGVVSEGTKGFIEPSLDEKPPSPISVEVQREWGVRLSKASTFNANPISQHGTDVEEASRGQRSLSGLITAKVSVKSSRKPSSYSTHSPQMNPMSPENSEKFLNPANVPLPMDVPVPPVEVPSTDEDSLSSYSSGDDQVSWQLQPGLITSPSALTTVLNSKAVFADKSSSTGKSPEIETVGSRRVSWFRNLLSPTDPNERYRSTLTAMPPRTPSRTKSDGLHRSSTAPSKPVVDLYVERDVAVGKVLDPRLSTPRQMITPGASQTFTKTIADLEYLLNEAMLVARLAVDKEDAPSILGTAAALLKGRRKSSGADSAHESARSLSPSESDSSEYDLQSREISVPHYIPIVRQPDEPSNTRNGEPAKEFSAPSLPKENEPKDSLVGSVGSKPLQKITRSPEDSSVIADSVQRNISRMPTRPRKNTISEFYQSDDADRGSLIDHKVPPPSRSRTLPIHTHSDEEDSKSTPAKRRINTAMVVSANSREIDPGEEDPLLAPKGSGQPLTHVRISKGADPNTAKDPGREKTMLNAQKIHEYIKIMHEPPIQARGSSRRLSSKTMPANRSRAGTTSALDAVHSNVLMTPSHTSSSLRSLDGPHDSEIEFTGRDFSDGHDIVDIGEVRDGIELTDLPDSTLPKRHISGRRMHDYHYTSDLKNKSYISLKDSRGFSLARSYRRQPIARDWSPAKKRFVASVACISTALIGILIGIYAGEVPSIQYYIVDFHHYTILGNVFFYIGLAIPTIYFWPLPLMHGRKPYTLSAMAIAMPLLFPQAVAVSIVRSPYLRYWRVGLLLPRAFMGFALGFANMNFKNTLMDLFGASLQSGNPHQEVVDEHDVRRHGGGMGIWLGIWTWCSLGSLGVGFLIGAAIINTLNPTWGFYVSIILIAAVLFLNVICPEVRRSAYRRSVVEVQTAEDGISRRLARGEVKMHRVQTGPTWWGQEVHHGMLLSQNMLRQPGFLVMAFYVAWIYAQIVLIIVLLGSLMSKYYLFKSPKVGASVTAVPIGVLLSVPFQKASLFSRARHDSPKTNTMTIGEKVHLSSHVIRRAIFTLVLPFAGMAYTVSSGGPPTPFIIPIIFAALIGFLSGLAIAECHGLIMENWDTSDLQPGMTGRPRGKSGDKSAMKRTNYSSFPRVSSAFAITQSLGYLLAAAATGVGGVAQRHLGQQSATGVMAAILLLLTFLLLGVLIRFKEVQIIPDSKKEAMERWKDARAASIVQKEQGAAAVEEPWRPVIIGNPTGMTRRMSILESGSLSRWSEIRRKNRLIDSWSLEAKHPNLAVLENVRAAVKEEEQKFVEEIRQGAEKVSQEAEKAWGQAKVALSRSNSRRSVRGSSTRSSEKHAGDLGGHVEVLKGWRSSSGRDSPARLPSDERRNNKKTEGRGSKRRVSEVRTMTP